MILLLAPQRSASLDALEGPSRPCPKPSLCSHLLSLRLHQRGTAAELVFPSLEVGPPCDLAF